ncbi:hypothetical protein LX24_02165 [Desulfallas thermosapovorans DSM 6562]|uniref:Uncharacterized protein n=1 Tax=Desulfallas thermosapovorans DSM 6562 TaxID=1121431 RepID=A0A5S4ZPH2_9FIRM|nr:hypothetical protein LX24_02165 [Desulfallas thermosapovorans DSM 6562]
MLSNKYQLSIVTLTKNHVFFNFFVNGSLANTDGYICMSINDFDRLYKDLFRSSKGQCTKNFSSNPPVQFFT